MPRSLAALLLSLACAALACPANLSGGGGANDDAGLPPAPECAADADCQDACQKAAIAESAAIADAGAGIAVSIVDKDCRETACLCGLQAGAKCFWKGSSADFETPCPPTRAALDAHFAP